MHPPCIYIPLRSQRLPTLQPADTPSVCQPMAPRARCIEAKTIHHYRRRRLSSRRDSSRPRSAHHKRRRSVLAGYTKLFKWDLLDGTLPNALPASSRSLPRVTRFKTPRSSYSTPGAIRSSSFDGGCLFRQHVLTRARVKLLADVEHSFALETCVEALVIFRRNPR